jgi:hypothetical protein
MGIDFNDAEGIEPELLEQAQKGEAMMKKAVATDGESLKISGGGGGGGGQLSFEQVLQQSQDKITEVDKVNLMGGYTGLEKCKYDTSLAYAKWIRARNSYKKCDDNVKEKSVKYTALVNGKAQTHEINKAYKEWTDIREKCNNSMMDLKEQANQYIETDRRCRANQQANNDIYPSITLDENKMGFEVRRQVNTNTANVEGFFGSSTNIKEGFNFNTGSADSASNPLNNNVFTYNKRLPRYGDTTQYKSTQENQTILPWDEYFTVCGNDEKCKAALQPSSDYVSIDNFNSTINELFIKADRLLNINNVSILKSVFNQNNNLLTVPQIGDILDNQKKNIALYKQNAIYDYDEYNNLAFYEDLVVFIYYAVFAIFVFMSLREFFSSASGSYDNRNIIILILLGIYPKYILQVVLWILNSLTNIAELLGVKNVRFWGWSS